MAGNAVKGPKGKTRRSAAHYVGRRVRSCVCYGCRALREPMSFDSSIMSWIIPRDSVSLTTMYNVMASIAPGGGAMYSMLFSSTLISVICAAAGHTAATTRDVRQRKSACMHAQVHAPREPGADVNVKSTGDCHGSVSRDVDLDGATGRASQAWQPPKTPAPPHARGDGRHRLAQQDKTQ